MVNTVHIVITSRTVANNSYLGNQKCLNTSPESDSRQENTVWTANANLKTSKTDANTDTHSRQSYLFTFVSLSHETV